MEKIILLFSEQFQLYYCKQKGVSFNKIPSIVFWYILVCGTCNMWTKQFKPWEVPVVVGSIVVVGALARCALLRFTCDLKAAHMNVQMSLIRELLLYEFELDHNEAKGTKNICCVKGEGAFDHCTVTRWFKKFLSSCKNLDD